MKKYKFFFHYNKPLSKLAKTPKLNIHFRDKCIIVDHVNCHTPIQSKHNKRQPFCVMTGYAGECSIKEDGGKLTANLL